MHVLQEQRIKSEGFITCQILYMNTTAVIDTVGGWAVLCLFVCYVALLNVLSLCLTSRGWLVLITADM